MRENAPVTATSPPPRTVWGDHLVEVATWLVAWWSLLYWAGWSLDLSLWPLGWVWVVTSVLGVAAVAVRSRRRRPRPAPADQPTGPSEPSADDRRTGGRRVELLRAGATGGAGVAVALLLVAVRDWPRSGWPLLWGLPVVALLLGLAAALALPARPTAAGGVRRVEHLAAAALALAVGVLALFVNLPDYDDPYYVNRSVWIAEQGTAMTRDTIFGPGTYVSPYNGGIPIASIEALEGVLAHLSGISVGSLTWLVTTGIGAVGTVWAFWALARRWSLRTPLVVLVVAVAFMLLSGESRLGNFWIARMWQGKVLALTVLLPLVWVWADDLVRTRDRRRWWTMLVAGVAFVGLTSTAVILVPFLVGGMLVAALVLRHRELAVGALLLLVGPVVSGAAVVLLSTGVGDNGALRYGPETFRRVLGPDHWMVVVALVALGLAPLLVRGRAAALMAGATVLATFVVLVPPLLELADALTGSGPILWRVLYCVPIGVLVGLLAVVRLPRWTGPARPVAAVALPVAMVASFALAGAGLWDTTDHNGPAQLTSRPTWKVDLTAKAEVEAVLDAGATGVVLLPPMAMQVLPMVTTDAYAVDPRGWYTRILAEPQAQNEQRRLLARYARDKTPQLTGEDLGRALSTLDVTVVCVKQARAERELPRLAEAGYADPQRRADMTCVTPT